MKETRIIRAEVRASMAGNTMRVSGIAARYNNPTIIGGKSKKAFREILVPGAFRRAVEQRDDAAFLINHDQNRLMGRVSSGTLRLRDTADGLCFDCDFPDTDDARSAYASIERGDLNGCSFDMGLSDSDSDWSFEDDQQRGRIAVRKIRSISSLNDVSAVVHPAYPNTSVNARSQEEFENRSEIEIPAEFRVEESETDSVEALARRRQLFSISLL